MTGVQAMSFAVVGAAHKNADGSDRQAEIDVCEPGEPVDLIPEPENEFDRHAIAVWSCREVQIGYISAERAPRLGTMMGQHDAVAVFQRPATFGAWIRVAFDGQAPVLTDGMLVEHDEPGEVFVDAEPDFYPDEVWPDDRGERKLIRVRSACNLRGMLVFLRDSGDFHISGSSNDRHRCLCAGCAYRPAFGRHRL